MIRVVFSFQAYPLFSSEVKVVVNDQVNDFFVMKSLTRIRITQCASSMFTD